MRFISNEKLLKSFPNLAACNTCGPIKLASNSKKWYKITFTYDYRKTIWVYFLPKKSKPLAIFKSFKIHVEKITNVSLKSMYIDRDGEFTYEEFNKFCDEHGIKRTNSCIVTSTKWCRIMKKPYHHEFGT